MIEKLYNLKKTQTDQKLMEKGQILSEIEKIDSEILFTKNKIDTATIDKLGSISDFSLLQIHKNTMNYHIQLLEKNKNELNTKLEAVIKEIIDFQKETEQYSYILEEEKAESLKKLLVVEQEASDEYIQSKYISKG